MYFYNAQGTLEQFTTTYYDVAQELVQQEKQRQVTQQERAAITANVLQSIAQESQINMAPVEIGTDVSCVISNSKDASEVQKRCGKCCQDANTILIRTAVVDKNKNRCKCAKFETSRESDKQIIYPASFLQNTNTNAGIYQSSIQSAEQCRDACLKDTTCAYSMFSKQGLCYLATANHKKGTKQELSGNIIDYKLLPSNVEGVSSARYIAAASNIKNIKPLSQPNCAQACINDTSCKYASASSSMDCETSTLPIQNATLVSDVNAVTYVP